MPGLRAGYYLCFFGMHVLTPGGAADCSASCSRGATAASRVQLPRRARRSSPSSERYLACELEAAATTSACKYGLLTAQLALALSGKDRDEVLARPRGTAARRSRSRHVARPHRHHHLARRRRCAIARSTSSARAASLRRAARRVRRARSVPPQQRQPLRARPRALFPLRDPSLPSARHAGADAGRARFRFTATSTCSSAASRKRSRFSPRRRRPTARATR